MSVLPKEEEGRAPSAVFGNCELSQSGRKDDWVFVDTAVLCRCNPRALKDCDVNGNALPIIWFWG